MLLLSELDNFSHLQHRWVQDGDGDDHDDADDDKNVSYVQDEDDGHS